MKVTIEQLRTVKKIIEVMEDDFLDGMITGVFYMNLHELLEKADEIKSYGGVSTPDGEETIFNYIAQVAEINH